MNAQSKFDAALAALEPPVRPARRWLSGRRLLIMALPVALLIGGSYAWVTGGRYVGTEDAYVKQDRISIVPQISGEIATVAVTENQPVTKGQQLFTLDDAAYRTALEADRARLEEARLGVEKLEAAYQQAVSEAATARDALATAETQDERQRSLLKTGVVSQSAADDSALKLQQARGAVASADSGVVSARAALAGNPDIPTDQHPDVLEALAALHAAELDLSHTVVTAPGDGVVSQTGRLQPGQYATPATAVLSLVATGDTWIEANFKETDLQHMRVGQAVSLTLDAYPGQPLKGAVASIGAGTGSEFALLPAQNASGNWVKVVQRVPVRIRLESDQALPPLRTGMSSAVSVDTGHSRGLPRPIAAAFGLEGGTAAAAQ